MAVYAVGDVQGCHEALLRLLDQLKFDPAADQLWLTGDLVNRGPDSLGVLRTVRSLGPSATVVLGNHDLHLLAQAWGNTGRGRCDLGLAEVLAAPDAAELLEWLSGCPLMHHDARLGRVLVHAGLLPQWSIREALALAAEVESMLRDSPRELLSAMYGDEPDHWQAELTGLGRLRLVINALTRLRFLDATGRMLLDLKGPPDSAPAGALPWFRHPQRRSREANIVFGHWSALGLLQEPGLLCLDGGYLWGGSLCAARLDADEPPVQLPNDTARGLAP